MAINILSILIMSDELERIFLGIRRTISWERAQIEIENPKKIECLKYRKRNNISLNKIFEIIK
jgi:hypothetical protein